MKDGDLKTEISNEVSALVEAVKSYMKGLGISRPLICGSFGLALRLSPYNLA